MEIRIAKTTVLAIALVVIGAALRLLPHTANFAPVGAIALFAGVVMGWRTALWIPLLIMAVSDIVLGFYPSVLFTWGAFLLVVGYGMLLRKQRNLVRVPLGAVGSALIFFVVSNFGVWAEGRLYPVTWQGLVDCYAMGLPFLRSTFLSDLSFAVIFFGLYSLVEPVFGGIFSLSVKRPVALAKEAGNTLD